ncbi:MAG UNVERIFIED_CONTAM: TetR/AcrR family transcriptional regulator [Anaerolineae bacterium]|jgi:AcrR family transcriptional regulator
MLPNKQERKQEIRTDLILRAAARLIDKMGYANLTMELLADEAGISRPTLYKHFPNIQEVVATIVIRGYEQAIQYMQAISHQTAVRQLEAILRYLFNISYEPSGFGSTLIYDELQRVLNDNQEVNSQYLQIISMLNRLIEQAKASRDVRSDLANEVIVAMMFSLVEVSALGRMSHTKLRYDEIVDQVVMVFFNGLRPKL